jgi:anhydro-N-acetylmuramic acid kinase
MGFAIGMMSGTSMDGIDVSLIEVKRRPKFVRGAFYPYPSEVKDFILKITTLEDLTYANFALGEMFALSAKKFIDSLGIEKNKILLISSHGQTIRHLPKFIKVGSLKVRGTLQIGDISVIAVRTGIITVGDFRPAHIAGGGEGAPLSPFFHREFFFSKNEKRAVVNIGGIANITFINSQPMLAFDTGPGNMVIDGVVKRLFGKEMDKDGKIASRGRANELIIKELLSHPFFKKKPPKSTGREDFGMPFIQKLISLSQERNLSREDIVSTASEITVRSIIDAIKRYSPYKPESIIICGGGAKNLYLLNRLREELKVVTVSDEFGFPVKSVESAGFALMGYYLLKKIPNDPERRLLLGKVAFPPFRRVNS